MATPCARSVLSAACAALAAALLALPGAARSDPPPGTFTVPGTQTTARFYGYVQLDTTLDMAAHQDLNTADWSDYPAVIPLDHPADAASQLLRNESPQFYWTARTTRFGITTTTPTALGEIGTKIEADFNGAEKNSPSPYTNSFYFRLRHAYGTLGKWLLIGQSWSSYADLASFSDTVAFNPSIDVPAIRQAQVRFTLPVGPGSLILAAENPANYATLSSGAGANVGKTDTSSFGGLPDFVAGYVMPVSWGHFSLRGVALHYETPNVPSGKEAFAATLSGSVKLYGDSLLWSIQAGAPGRYMWSSMGAGDERAQADATNSQLLLWKGLGYHVDFTHVWSPEFRSNVAFCQVRIQDDADLRTALGDAAYNLKNRYLHQLFLNTFWTATKNLEFGVEYEWAQREDFSGAQGNLHRINATAHFNLY